jgi:hypothetical protein
VTETPDEGGSEFRCARGDHLWCGHVPSRIITLLLRGKEFRAELTVSPLCTCDCHASCPLTAGGATQWPERCDCPATERMVQAAQRRQQLGNRHGVDLRESWRRSKDKSRRRKRAREAVRSALAQPGAARGREDVSELIDREWTAQGLDRPAEPVRGLLIDRFLEVHPDRIRDARLTLEVGAAAVAMPFRLVTLIRGLAKDSQDDHANTYEEEAPERERHIDTGSQTVRVVLVSGAQGRLGALPNFTSLFPTIAGITGVEVALSPDGIDTASRRLAVHVPAGERLGVLSHRDAQPFWRQLDAALLSGQTTLCSAWRSRAPDGSWQLDLCLPATQDGVPDRV